MGICCAHVHPHAHLCVLAQAEEHELLAEVSLLDPHGASLDTHLGGADHVHDAHPLPGGCEVQSKIHNFTVNKMHLNALLLVSLQTCALPDVCLAVCLSELLCLCCARYVSLSAVSSLRSHNLLATSGVLTLDGLRNI
jgi:hypothetical protein